MEHWHHFDEFDIDGRLEVFNVNYTIVNGSDEQLVNVNAGGTDVDAYSYKDGVTLTNTELAALLANNAFGAFNNVAVFADLTGDATALTKKRSIAAAASRASA
jgi:hypothetical protein